MTLGRERSPIRAANDLSIILRTALKDDRFPVDVEALCLEYTKIYSDPITKVVGDSLGSFEGMLRPGRKKPCWHIIYNNDTNYRGRERFTLAHELGHYLLHRQPLIEGDTPTDMEARTFSCNPMERYRWQQAEEGREEEADIFASYLLMPLDDYRQQIAGQDFCLDLLRHITQRYGVSLTAAVRKWISFTDKRAAMIVSRDGFALWGRASDAAVRTGIYIRSGMPIPPTSVAALGPAAQGADPSRPIPHPQGVWSFRRGGEPVRELTIFSPRLAQALTILLFEDAPGRYRLYEPSAWDTYDQFMART